MSKNFENGFKHTDEDLRTMQGWPLERKIRVAQTRIIEWYQHHEGNVYVSFSGGKDSTVLLDLVRRVYPDVPAVFFDTGMEYPEIREFVKTFDNVEWVRPSMRFKDVIDKYGYPVVTKKQAEFIGRVRRTKHPHVKERLMDYRKYGKYSISKKWRYLVDAPFNIGSECCAVMKKRPARDYHKRTGSVPYIGVLASEGEMRTRSFLSLGCNAFNGKEPRSAPLLPWLEQDILQYLKLTGIPYSTIYGDILEDDNGQLYLSGAPRTGCMFCAFGTHMEKGTNRFQRMKNTHPKQFEFCMKPVDKGGLGMAAVLDYINVPHDYEGEYEKYERVEQKGDKD